MWNPFKKQKEAEERAAKAEALLKKLNDKIEAEEAEKKAVYEKKQELARLAAEAIAKKNAEKNLATQNELPYVNIVRIEVDGDHITEGEIELDWNDFFIIDLKKQGYVGDNEEEVVDQWFRDVCKHIVLETYEQANSSIGHEAHGPSRKDLGGGSVEYT